MPVPRPAGLEPPRVKAPGPSRTGAGLGAASPAWRASGLTLLWLVSPLSEAMARPRVNGPAAWGLARPPAFGAGEGWGRGTDRLCVGAGGVSARERRGTTPSVASQETRLAPPLVLPFAGVGIGSRWTLKDPVKTGRHPLGVVAVIVTIATIVLIRGLFLRFPPLPGFRSARLQRLALEVLLLLLFLF